MQVKKFEAPSIQEALDAIKRELGPEAIILQTKRNKRGFGLMNGASVEITAAISDRSAQKKRYEESKRTKVFGSRSEEINRTPYERLVAPTKTEAAPKTSERRYADIDSHELEIPTPEPVSRSVRVTPTEANLKGLGLSVEDEVKYLKRMIEEVRTTQEQQHQSGLNASFATQLSQSPALMDAFEHLVLNGVDKRFALGLVKKAGFELGPEESLNPDSVMDQVTFEIMGATETKSLLAHLTPGSRAEQGPQLIALVGPTGVGKTTTIAKIGAEAILKRNLRVGFINLDLFKIAATDQLSTYAKILNVPFRQATSREEFEGALLDFKSLDLVLIDTTGRSPRDPEALKEMNALLRSVERQIQTELVVMASTRDMEAYDIAHRFSVFKPSGLILSKLDEATLFGALHNVSQKAKLPLSYFTTGQRVPEDIEEATRERVAALIMDL